MRHFALRTGVRWKISIAIAGVGALIAIALSLVVHNAARVSMLDNARDTQVGRLQFALRLYESKKQQLPQFGSKVNDPTLPAELRRRAADNRLSTLIVEHADDVPDVWAAAPLANGSVLSLHSRYSSNATVMQDLDRALVIGSVSVVLGGSALGVLIGGSSHGGSARRQRRRARSHTAVRMSGSGTPSAVSYATRPTSWPAPWTR